MLETKDLQKLMQRAKAGDTDAFALLYENFYTPIFRYVFRKISDANEAEDLTQTVFMKAFAARENFADQHQSPIAYFYTIARNLITDTYRKKDRTPVTIDSTKDEDFWDRIPDQELDPMAEVIKSDQAQATQELLQVLKPEHREVIEMKFLQDCSNAEIAKRTGKTEDNIRQIQVRSLRKLKKQLL
jgi:RNA polymerase sigma-70 factor (ECF subfamily)